ncbi:MAG: restriction endonuclease subunit S [Spirochaetaceae bacterium]|nr:restriction endonuclease subunit S [Spirochaetaceae bacterium]
MNDERTINVDIIDAPYELPEGWKWVRLGDVAEIIMGQSPTGNSMSENPNDIAFIGGASDMGAELPKITRYTSSPTKISKKNDVIVCIRATLGRPIFSDGVYCLGRGVAGVRSENLTKEYIKYGFINFEQYLYDNATGSTFLQVSSDSLKKMPFPLPPTLAEQQRIVNRIESMFAKLDEAKEKAQNVVDCFETRKAAILHQAFTGNLTAKWRKENGVSDDSWEKKFFDSCIAKMQNGLSKRSGEEGEETVVLRLANIGEDDFDISDLRTIKLTSKEQENYSLTKDDVVMIRVNGSKTNVGRQILVRNNDGWSFCDHIIRIKFESFCMPNYMVYFSNTKEYKDYVQDNMVSSAGQNTISRKGLSNLTLKIPTLGEQQEIVRILDTVLEKERTAKSAAEQVLEQIDLLKKSILARAFRGEL